MFGFRILSQGNFTKWLILNSQIDLSKCSKLQMSKDNSHFEITWITRIHKWLPNYCQIKITALPHLISVIRLEKLLHLHVAFSPWPSSFSKGRIEGKYWRGGNREREGWKALAMKRSLSVGGWSWKEPNHFAEGGANTVIKKGGRSEEGRRERENASQGQALQVMWLGGC